MSVRMLISVPMNAPLPSNTRNVKPTGRSAGGGVPRVGKPWFGRLHTMRFGTGGTRQVQPRAVSSTGVKLAFTDSTPTPSPLDGCAAVEIECSVGARADVGVTGDAHPIATSAHPHSSGR